MITFVQKVRQAYEKILAERYEKDYGKAVVSYLGICVDRLADYLSNFTRWLNTLEAVSGTFGRQALGMVWDYVEICPISKAGGDWNSALDWVLRTIVHTTQTSCVPACITQSSAITLICEDNSFDAVITDPPYYDNVPYSYLSDFFYVWLKRTIGDLYPDLFATPLSPKSEEIVAYSHGENGFEGGKKFFEDTIAKAFRETCRVLKPEGVACIVFAHKSTEAWETIINALLNSGLYLTGSWPLHTERGVRLRSKESAALASSIYMVCRKRTEKQTAYFNEIKPQIEQRIKEKLDQFWNEGIGGSDFFISAIGPAMEVFGKYDSVEKLSGEKVSAKELLEFVRKSVSEYALSKILKSPELTGIDEPTRFYLLWRWTYDSSKVHFDDARKLSQAVGMEITEQWSDGFVKKDKEFIEVLDAKGRGKKYLEKAKFESMIDVVHACLLLWERNDRKSMGELLSATGYGKSNAFWQVAQAISDVLPSGDNEKKMLEGFLYGRSTYAKVDKQQKTLFEE
jgi:putative DNA methylase